MNLTHRKLRKRGNRFLISILLSIAILFSCQKVEVKPFPEVGYPYTYNVLTNSEWSTRNALFQQINLFDSLSLDEYGFVDGSIQLDKDDSINAEYVFVMIDSIINTYRDFLGIPENETIKIKNELTIAHWMGHGDTMSAELYFRTLSIPGHGGSYIFYIWIEQKTIGTVRINPVHLYFILDAAEKKIGIKGNWFPKLFLPSFEIYSEKEAVNIAFNFANNEGKQKFGDWNVNEDIYSVDKRFNPIYFEDKIEMHECWFVSMPINPYPLFPDAVTFRHVEIFVDTQTGEVLSCRIINDYPV